MTRAISHGEIEIITVPDSSNIEQMIDIKARFVIRSAEQEDLIKALNAVIDRYSI